MPFSFRRLDSSAFGVRAVRFSALLLLLLLAGEFGQSQAAGIALVQHTGKDAGTTTTTTLAFASPNTAGNFIAVAIRGGLSNSQVFTVKDSVGNTYKQATQLSLSGSAVTAAMYYAENVKGGANTITVSMTVSGPLRIAIAEYSGVAQSNSLDGTAAGTVTSTSPNSGNLTTTANGDLLLGAVGTADSDTFTVGTGYTIREFVPAEPNTKLITEDQVQTAAGTVSATATLSVSSNWGALLAAFKPAGGVVAPSIASLSPASGPVGTSVTITGSNFGASQGASTVSFNGVAATPTSWSATSIVVPVPSGATSGTVVVTVGGVASNPVAFTVTVPPSITGLSPTSGPVGTAVTIAGTNFGSSQGTSTVTLNGTMLPVTSWAATSIATFVPNGATTGNVVVTVGGLASNGVLFTVTPSINTISPTSGPAGTSVTITGANFGPTQGTSSVMFGSSTATVTSWSNTSVVAIVPSNLSAFTNVNVQIVVSGVASNGVVFAIAPSITTLSPASGPVATSVTITGTNFTLTQGTVTFSGTPATPTSWNATSIVVPVPAGGTTGNVVVTVSGLASNGVSFTVIPTPTITSLNPTLGPVGTSLTITGTNFGASQGTSAVTFNGTPATPASWSSTSIVVPVPRGATTGNVVVTVGGVPSSGVAFTVIPPSITTLSPSSGPIGTSVTITGTNFGAIQGTSVVRFSGTVAPPTSWSDTSIVVPVPGGATTGNVVVTVGALSSNGILFTVIAPPTISSLSPASGSVGTSVTISGTNFGPAQGASTVTFNGTPATPTSWSDTGVTVPVPVGASTGNVFVTVGGVASNGASFTVLAISVTVSPASVTLGTGAVQNFSVTLQNDTQGKGVTWSLSGPGCSGAACGTIQPNNAAPGEIYTAPATAPNPSAVTLTATSVADSSKSASATITVVQATAPNITSLNPSSGPLGSSVTITGTNFGNTQGSSVLWFNSTQGVATSWSNTSIVATVPTSLLGNANALVQVVVLGLASNQVNFSITPAPTITSLSPATGPVSSSVTIAGANFGTTQGTSTVTFNGTAATPTSWSSTSIAVLVPNGATTGNVVVTVGGVASNGVGFTVLPTPNITSITPSGAQVGASVTIAGTNFGASQGSSSITFNVTQATPTSWGQTSITVPVPSGASTGNVVIAVNGVPSNAVPFTVAPTITNLNPLSGPVGTSVLITGTNFGTFVAGDTVTFNGTPAATIQSWIDTGISVLVPSGGATGPAVVTIGGFASNSFNFTVTPVTITALNPTSGPAGTPVTITGTNFGPTQGSSAVAFAGFGATTPTSWSQTTIVVPVPIGAVTGNVTVMVGGVTSNAVPFTVTSPNISSLSPNNGPVGSSVTVSGANFGASQGTSTVTFNGIAATPTSWSPTSLIVTVPAGATTGQVVVTVSGMAGNGVNFVVTPKITSLNPSSGPIGTAVTVSGLNFWASQGTSQVTVGGVGVAPTSWSANSLGGVTIPNLSAGPAGVSVSVGGFGSNFVAFQVTPSITSLSPNSGPVGTSVTITGSTFGGTQGTSTVSFNGVLANPTSWSNFSIIVPVPSGATTGNVVVTVAGQASNGVLFTVATPPANIALVQHIGKDAGTTTTTTLAFNSANTAGNFIAVAIRGGLSNSQVFTVKDSNSNTYKQANQLSSSGSAVTSAIYYAENIKGSANTITVTMTVSGPLRIDILEYSGVATSNSLDATAAATTTSTSPNSGNLTTTANGDLLLGEVSTADSTTFTAGSGYAIRDFVPVEPNTKLITEDQIQSAAGTASASATLSVSSNWGAILAAFKAAGGTGGGAGTPASITATAGTPQSATVNTVFASQLQATVKDSLNNPVSGVTVTFTVPASGASGGFFLALNTATTNASGVATSAVFTANSISGPYTVTASVSGVPIPANFSLTNLAGSPANIIVAAGTPQSAPVNTAFATQLQASVRDSFNNPVSGVTVTFTVPASGASGAFAGGVNTATTNAQGVATAPVFTANATAGSYTVTVSASGVATIANFSLTNLSGPPASVTATAGTLQSATVNTAFPAGLQVTVKDASNNPLSNVTVTFTVPGSGASGTFAGGLTTGLTDTAGHAMLGVFTANTVAGTYTVTATVAGVGTPANFSLTNLAGSAANIAATGGTPQSAVINTAFATPLQATVTDSLNNPVSGVTVTFTAPASGASGAFAGGVNTVTTNAQGMATAPAFTSNGTVGGPYNVTATTSGVSTPAGFSLTNLPTSGNISHVQHRSIDSAPATSNSLAFVSNTTAGNWIAVCIRGGLSSSQVFSVTDSSGNTYHQAFRLGLATSSNTFALFYAENIKGGPDAVTVTQSVFGPLRFAILEYSGVATSNSLDVPPVTAQGNSASPNSGNLTTVSNGDLLLGTVITQNGEAYTAGSGYTIEESVPASPNTKLIAEDQLQSVAGAASAGASFPASESWGAGLAAFRSIIGTTLPISVSISPNTASVPSGYGTQAFTATATNDFLGRGVTWSLSGAGCSGSACGTLSRITASSVTYTAPLNVPNPANVTLTATSIGDATKSAPATITLTQGVLTIVLSPKRAAATVSSSPLQFTANIFNDPSNSGVTWQVDGNNGGNSASGTISATGLYTPGTQPGQHTVTAISNANASVSASALMALTDFSGVFTHHNDNARTGQNLKEYGLTPATVNSTSFGQLFSCPVDGYVYAQPLWVANLNVGGTIRNVVFVATEHNSVYAFDADSPSCIQLWRVNFLASGVTTLTSADIQSNTDIVPEIGITSTPVIDPATNTLYVVPKTRETVGTVSGQTCSSGSPCYVHRLHALDLATGAEKLGGPVVITAPNFVPLKHLQRPALLLANNTLYLSFGSHGDQCNYQGWVMGYNPATLAQSFATSLSDARPTAGCNQGAVWQSGAGPAADASGNVYVVTGNGLYDGTLNFGDSVVKLSPAGSILDWFTPFNQSVLAANDVDLGSAGVLILPDSVASAAHPHLALATGKISILYLLDQTSMGKFNSASNNDVQEVIPVPPINTTLNDGGNYGVPAYWNGNIYSTGQNFPLSQFQISNGAISTPQSASSSNTFPPRGGIPAVSANGASGGIVWIVDYSGWVNSTAAVLDAYDATNVRTLLFSSPVSGAGSAGPSVKWSVPTVANGKVYIGTQFFFTVYGLLPN